MTKGKAIIHLGTETCRRVWVSACGFCALLVSEPWSICRCFPPATLNTQTQASFRLSKIKRSCLLCWFDDGDDNSFFLSWVKPTLCAQKEGKKCDLVATCLTRWTEHQTVVSVLFEKRDLTWGSYTLLNWKTENRKLSATSLIALTAICLCSQHSL